MIKQALNAPTINVIMRMFSKDDAIKLLGKSTYNKWLKKLPASRIGRYTDAPGYDTGVVLKALQDKSRVLEADRLKRAQDVSDVLMHRYGPGFEANLPRVNERLDTRGRLKGAMLRSLPRRNFLREFIDRNNLVSRDELLRWNRAHKAGLDPKTLTSEWYTAPTTGGDKNIVVASLRNPRFKSVFYNRKFIPEDIAYRNAQTVRNIAAVPYTDPIRHTAEQLVANELHTTLDDNARRRAIYNAASDNTRKVLNYLDGRNVLEDPIAARLVESANKHGRLNIDIPWLFKDGDNAAYLPDHNILAVHPGLTQDIKNHEWVHYLLHNMDVKDHANIASRVFRGISAISRRNPEYSRLVDNLIKRYTETHEAVTDYYRHKLFGTSGSRVDDFRTMGKLNTEPRLYEPVIGRTVYEIQNLTSNPSLQQALQQLAINYGVPLSTSAQVPESVIAQIRQAMNLN